MTEMAVSVEVVRPALQPSLQTTKGRQQGRFTGRRWLLVVALVSGTATQLRVGPIGLSEVAILAYVIASAVTVAPARRDASLFNAAALTVAVIAISEAFGSMISTFRSVPFAGGGHDAIALSFAALFVITASRHELQDTDALRSVWRRVVIGLTGLGGTCLAAGQFVGGVGPIDFWYKGSDRFVGLSANPNQIPVFFGWMPAATFFLFRGWRRWVLIGVQLGIGFASHSDGFQLAQVAALATAVVASGMGDVLGKRTGRGVLFGVVSIGTVIGTLPFTMKLITERSDEALAGGGNGRASLFGKAINVIGDSPVFGHGPGAWIVTANGQIFEAHNNYLDLALQGGLVAVGALVVFQMWALLRSIAVPALAGSLGALVSFGMTGLQLRWPIYWFVWLASARFAWHVHRERRVAVDRAPAAETSRPAIRPGLTAHRTR